MKQRPLFILAALFILLLAGFLSYTFFFKGKAGTTRFNGTLYQLVSQQGIKLCTFEKTEDNIKTSGFVQISGDKFTSDIQSTGDDVSLTAHFIGDGKKLYSWTDLRNIPGVAMSYKDFESPRSETQRNGLLYQSNTYNCSTLKTKPSDSKFKLPKGITFKDV